ncbi:MAG: hypothetical protein IIB39_02660 [Candidatus Marinimicrobia bacterium]|nr:hypothetical protein [Candidatus Neomarinimicrobiota bacterium]
MGIAGFESLLKWGIAVILTLSVIPMSLKSPGATDSDFKQVEEDRFDLSGYEIQVVKYKVNKKMLNSSIIRTYGFIVSHQGRRLTELYVQKHFRPDWEGSQNASDEYTIWALEERDGDGYKFIKQYPSYSKYVLIFPARDVAMLDVQNIIKERYITGIIHQ